jgi:arginyl-tRNA--protein-N-Asp/Glu arginylyltransferase
MQLAHFLTEFQTCPYLQDRPSRLEVRVVTNLSSAEYSARLGAGWRRFGSSLFRPACAGCRECVPLRVPVAAFRPSKSQRRVLRRNADLRLEVAPPRIDEERLRLHQRFHEERARTRGWPWPEGGLEQYFDTFIDNAAQTLELCYRLDGRLVAVAYVGVAHDALNSIYAFTEPDLSRRGLGTFDVLSEIQEAARRGKDYLYLGFHVAGCPSMEYKHSFRPYEILVDGCWARQEDRRPASSAPRRAL